MYVMPSNEENNEFDGIMFVSVPRKFYQFNYLVCFHSKNWVIFDIFVWMTQFVFICDVLGVGCGGEVQQSSAVSRIGSCWCNAIWWVVMAPESSFTSYSVQEQVDYILYSRKILYIIIVKCLPYYLKYYNARSKNTSSWKNDEFSKQKQKVTYR